MGGRTALELQGFAHYLTHETREVHLYGADHPPTWLSKLTLGVSFVHHNSARLFRGSLVAPGIAGSPQPDVVAHPWGQWESSLTLSSPDRALLELLDELPDRESFHQVDKLVEGLANLSPSRLEKLLLDCKSVKVKRLFFLPRRRNLWVTGIQSALEGPARAIGEPNGDSAASAGCCL